MVLLCVFHWDVCQDAIVWIGALVEAGCSRRATSQVPNSSVRLNYLPQAPRSNGLMFIVNCFGGPLFGCRTFEFWKALIIFNVLVKGTFNEFVLKRHSNWSKLIHHPIDSQIMECGFHFTLTKPKQYSLFPDHHSYPLHLNANRGTRPAVNPS